jgi:hypothetical protein
MTEYNKDSSEGIETIKDGCPICKGDVKGNNNYMFYCKACNVLFKRDELLLGKAHIAGLVKKHVMERYKSEGLPVDPPVIKLKNIPVGVLSAAHAKKQDKKVINDYVHARFYLASKKSDVVHSDNCPYARNIKKSNRIIFDDISKAKGYRRCTCII